MFAYSMDLFLTRSQFLEPASCLRLCETFIHFATSGFRVYGVWCIILLIDMRFPFASDLGVSAKLLHVIISYNLERQSTRTESSRCLWMFLKDSAMFRASNSVAAVCLTESGPGCWRVMPPPPGLPAISVNLLLRSLLSCIVAMYRSEMRLIFLV